MGMTLHDVKVTPVADVMWLLAARVGGGSSDAAREATQKDIDGFI